MRRVLGALAVAVLFAGPGFAQTPGNTLKFDAADISLRPHTGITSQGGMTGGVLRGGRYDLRNASMIDLIATAYSITDNDLIVGGPSWIEYDRFDVAAKAPDGTPQDSLRLMLQALLADRFQLKLHKDTRELDGGFVLKAGPGQPRMKEANGPGPGCQGSPQPNPPPAIPMIRGTCRGITTEQLAQVLRGIGNGYITGPVQDQTGLKGYWDFDLAITPFGALAQAGSDAVTIQQFVEKDLGLKLERGKAPVPVTVVDAVNQKPSANPSGVSASIPLAPTMEFDAAEIKLSMPDAQPRLQLLPGGRLTGDGITMQQIFNIVFDITQDDLIANTPKWWTETKYSIVAKSSTAVTGTGQNMAVDVDDLKAMVRQLITERFKMKSHYEERPVNAYTLIADKPKMTKADPSGRTGFKEGPAKGQADQRTAVLNRMVTVRNMTMEQFVEDLRRIAGGYVRVPVENKTALEGAYDFTLLFSGINLVQTQGRGGPGDGGGAGASDPNGALSLPDALNRQLGLKLEMRKRPMQVLVIDSMQEKPADN